MKFVITASFLLANASVSAFSLAPAAKTEKFSSTVSEEGKKIE